jgi:hypothetical protein
MGTSEPFPPNPLTPEPPNDRIQLTYRQLTALIEDAVRAITKD